MKRIHVWAAFVIYLFLHLFLALIVLNFDDKISTSFFDLKIRFDYFFHFLAFFPWAFWGYFLKFKLVIWLCIGMFFSFFIEGLHFFIPYRTYNVMDFLFNLSGIFFGFVILYFLLFLKKQNKRERV